MDNTDLILTNEFKAKVQVFRQECFNLYQDISKEPTPKFDGEGREIIGKKGNYDSVHDSWMRNRLDFHFPGWSWEMAAPLHFLGAEWVVAQGTLTIIDTSLIPLGVSPLRKFYGVDSVRIQYKKDLPHLPENLVDIGDNAQQANTGALKRAINRLTHICDDIYGKQMESDGAGTLESLLLTKNDSLTFSRWIQEERHISWADVFSILDIKGLGEVKDFVQAMHTIKDKRGWR